MCLMQNRVFYERRDPGVPLSTEDMLNESMELLMSIVSLMKSRFILGTGLTT